LVVVLLGEVLLLDGSLVLLQYRFPIEIVIIK